MPKKGDLKPDSQMKRYRKVLIDGKTISLHRLVMEQKLGRKLLPGEVVHHINGNKFDNRPETLAVMRAGEHSRLENIGRKLSPEHVEKIRSANMGNQHRKGIPHSEEIKEKIALSVIEARKKKFWSTKKK